MGRVLRHDQWPTTHSNIFPRCHQHCNFGAPAAYLDLPIMTPRQTISFMGWATLLILSLSCIQVSAQPEGQPADDDDTEYITPAMAVADLETLRWFLDEHPLGPKQA